MLGVLATLLLAGLGPGEVHDGNDEERITGVGDTGEGVVPGGEGSQDAERAASFDAARVGVAAGVAEIANAQEQESQVQGEEEEEESYG